LLFFFIAFPLVFGTRLPVCVEGCNRTSEFAARRPCHEQNAVGTSVSQFQYPFLSAASIQSCLDADRVVFQNLFDFAWTDSVQGDVSFVVLIPVIPDTRFM
jgi:hypothetical protein